MSRAVTEDLRATTVLAGFTVGITADRRGEDQAVMFRRLGAEVVLGPTLRTLSVPESDDLRRRTEEIIASPPDYLIANTGLGIRTWFAHAAELGLDEQLRAALGHGRIAARGPKASGAVSMAGMSVWWRSPSEQLADVTDRLISEGMAGRRVVFQLHGDRRRDVTTKLREAGADVLELPVYRWATPEGGPLEGALRLIEMCCDGDVDAITFTAGPQVRNMIEIADSAGKAGRLLTALNGKVLVGCIGPVCAEVAHEEGIHDLLVPDNWRLGSLVKAVAAALTGASDVPDPVPPGPSP
jgi:uroporphyrinogen-III synthase